MKIFLYKSLFIFFLVLILFKLTIGKLITDYEKKFEEAEWAFKTVLKIDPTHHNAWYSLGFTYELMGKKDEAEKSYKKYRRLKREIDSLMNQEKH